MKDLQAQGGTETSMVNIFKGSCTLIHIYVPISSFNSLSAFSSV